MTSELPWAPARALAASVVLTASREGSGRRKPAIMARAVAARFVPVSLSGTGEDVDSIQVLAMCDDSFRASDDA